VRDEIIGRSGTSLKPVKYLNEKAPLFLRVKQIYDLISTDPSRYDVYLLIYTCILFYEYGVGLPRRCATQEGPIGTKRKGKK